MLIENYKGVNIMHDAAKDEFYTQLVIRKGSYGKKDEYITATRLQKIRDNIDKFLNTASKKPILKKAWLRDKYDKGVQQVEVILYNAISNSVMIKKNDGNIQTISLSDTYNNHGTLLLNCAENNSNISILNKKYDEIKKIEKEVSCTGGKLIPLKLEHFTE